MASRRGDIDGLRGVACLAVLLFHANPAWLPGGFTGVDVFFVISGYVVTLSMEKASPERAAPLAFYARRVRRLAPLTLFTVLLTMAGVTLLVPADEEADSNVDEYGLVGTYHLSAISSLFGWANNYFAQRTATASAGGGGYFQALGRTLEWNPYTHFWSLGVEEQFYLGFPLGLRALRATGQSSATRAWPAFYAAAAPPAKARRAACSPHGRVAAVLGGLSAASLVCCCILGAVQPDVGFYLAPARAWQLLSGVSLCLGRARLRPSWRAALALEVVALACTAAAFILPPTDAFQIRGSILATAGTLAYIAAGACALPPPATLPRSATESPVDAVSASVEGVALPPPGRHWPPPAPLNSLLASPTCVYAGQLSYSAYLVHWPLFVLLRWSIGFSCTLVQVAALVATVLLSMAAHHGIERPLREIKGVAAQRRLTRGLLLTLGGTAALALGLYAGRVGRHRAVHPCAAEIYAYCVAEERANATPIASSPLAGCACPLNASVRYGDSPADPCYSSAAFDGWMAWSLQQRGGSAVPRPPRPHTLYLLGDSHANHLSLALAAAADVTQTHAVKDLTCAGVPFPYHAAGWVIGCNMTTVADPLAPEATCGSAPAGHPLCHPDAVARLLLGETFLQPGDVVVRPLERPTPRPLSPTLHTHPSQSPNRPLPLPTRARNQVVSNFYVASSAPVVLHGRTGTLWLEHVPRVVAELAQLAWHVSSQNASLLLMGDVPMLLARGDECAPPLPALNSVLGSWGCRLPCTVGRDADFYARVAMWNAELAAVAAAVPRTHFLDLHSRMCDEESGLCGPYIPGTTLLGWADRDHLTSEASFSLWPDFCRSFASFD